MRRGQAVPKGWKLTFLREYEAHGKIWYCAKRAGVGGQTVKNERARDAIFDAACDDALQHYADGLEVTMDDQFQKGNVVAGIVRLKAVRPDKYVEKHVVNTLAVNLTVQQVSEADATDFLHRLLAFATPETRAKLNGGAAPLALPTTATVLEGVRA